MQGGPADGESEGLQNLVAVYSGNAVNGFQSKHWAWWYLSISVGFLLLALVYLLHNARLFQIVARLVIALGFAALAWMQWKNGR